MVLSGGRGCRVGGWGGRGGGYSATLLYRDVPLDRVWFSVIPVLNRVCNLHVCVLNRVFIPWTSRRVILSRIACNRVRVKTLESCVGAWHNVQILILMFGVQSWTGFQIKTNILEQGIINGPLNTLQSTPLGFTHENKPVEMFFYCKLAKSQEIFAVLHEKRDWWKKQVLSVTFLQSDWLKWCQHHCVDSYLPLGVNQSESEKLLVKFHFGNG